jgi:hypothetical protein
VLVEVPFVGLVRFFFLRLLFFVVVDPSLPVTALLFVAEPPTFDSLWAGCPADDDRGMYFLQASGILVDLELWDESDFFRFESSGFDFPSSFELSLGFEFLEGFGFSSGFEVVVFARSEETVDDLVSFAPSEEPFGSLVGFDASEGFEGSVVFVGSVAFESLAASVVVDFEVDVEPSAAFRVVDSVGLVVASGALVSPSGFGDSVDFGASVAFELSGSLGVSPDGDGDSVVGSASVLASAKILTAIVR